MDSDLSAIYADALTAVLENCQARWIRRPVKLDDTTPLLQVALYAQPHARAHGWYRSESAPGSGMVEATLPVELENLTRLALPALWKAARERLERLSPGHASRWDKFKITVVVGSSFAIGNLEKTALAAYQASHRDGGAVARTLLAGGISRSYRDTPSTLPVVRLSNTGTPLPVSEFLITIPILHHQWSAEEERESLLAALAHELEHVWQIAWLGQPMHSLLYVTAFAEMCAVYREIAVAPASRALLDWVPGWREEGGVSLLTNGSYFGYRQFPAALVLEELCPGVLDRVWSRLLDPATAEVAHPWGLVAAELNASGKDMEQILRLLAGRTFLPGAEGLPDAWQLLHGRAGPRQEAFRLDLQQAALNNWNGFELGAEGRTTEFPPSLALTLWPLSCAPAVIVPHPGLDTVLHWEVDPSPRVPDPKPVILAWPLAGAASTAPLPLACSPSVPFVLQAGGPPVLMVLIHAQIPEILHQDHGVWRDAEVLQDIVPGYAITSRLHWSFEPSSQSVVDFF